MIAETLRPLAKAFRQLVARVAYDRDSHRIEADLSGGESRYRITVERLPSAPVTTTTPELPPRTIESSVSFPSDPPPAKPAARPVLRLVEAA